MSRKSVFPVVFLAVMLITLGCGLFSPSTIGSTPYPGAPTRAVAKEILENPMPILENPKKTFIEHCFFLTIRSGPGIKYPALEYIGRGSEVEILGPCKNRWRPVRYGTIEGWVNSYYLIGGCQ